MMGKLDRLDRPLYALFYNGKQVCKGHSTIIAVVTETFERGVMVTSGVPDFPEDGPYKAGSTCLLSAGYTIEETTDEQLPPDDPPSEDKAPRTGRGTRMWRA